MASSSDQYLVDNAPAESDDRDSVASNDTDDGNSHNPEKILARQDIKHKTHETTWFLVKWKNCPLLRSSWETGDLFRICPKLLEDWEIEAQKRAEGKSKFDLEAFNKAASDLDKAYTRRRQLRRLKKDISRLIDLAENT